MKCIYMLVQFRNSLPDEYMCYYDLVTSRSGTYIYGIDKQGEITENFEPHVIHFGKLIDKKFYIHESWNGDIVYQTTDKHDFIRFVMEYRSFKNL